VSIQETILTLSVVGTSASDLAGMGSAVQAAIARIITASTAVGSLQTQISTQQTFNGSLSDALTSGIGSLVDADMNVASTRLQALQTQQQLGIQALSVANNNSSLILKLFQAA
jgi:flagellin